MIFLLTCCRRCVVLIVKGAGGLVSYGISPPSDPGGLFAVDTGGTVRLARTLDREKLQVHHIKVLAWDSGQPPNTATATLTVNIVRAFNSCN